MTAIPRRKALCAILVLSLLGSLWWLCRPYEVGVATVTVTPTAESATERVQRKAAVEIARMPIDPWTLAESIAASSPSAVVSRCGEDQLSKRDGTGEVIEPGGSTYVEVRRRIDAALRANAEPLAVAMADRLDLEEVHTWNQRIESVAQRALATRDPRVYGLAYRSCQDLGDAPTSCALLNARQWAQLDQGNAVPWLFLLSQAARDGDLAAQEDALFHLASSARFDEGHRATVGLVAGVTSDEEANQAVENSVIREAVGLAAALPVPAQALVQSCREHGGGSESRAQVCTRIAELMFDHSDTILDRSIGAALYFVSTGDPSRRDSARAEQARFRDHWEQMTTSLAPCSEMRTERRYFQRMVEVGELDANRELLATPVQP